MNLKTRIALLPALAALIFGIGIAVVLSFSTRTLAVIHALESQDYPYLVATNQASAQFEALGGLFQSAVAEGEKRQLDQAAERAGAMRKVIASIQALDGRADAGARLLRDFDAYYGASVETVEMILGLRTGDQAGAVARMQGAQKAFEQALAAARTDAREGLDGALARAEGGVRAGLSVTVGCGVVVVLCLALGSWLLIVGVWRQLGGEPEYARQVMRRMAEGDLSQRIEVARGTDHSLLAAVRDMARGLSGLVAEVRGGTESIGVASRQIAAGNQDLSGRTERQAGSLEETSSHMRQLTEAVHQSADAASQANQLAGNAAAVALKGGEVVGRVVSTMEEISASSRRIGDIIGTIDSIAFQTNILALNAAVEAARAGEQGRGFAVVAGEVRALAQRSAEAAREIKTLIAASMEGVDAGSRLVRDAGDTMRDIMTSAQRVSDIVGDITAASLEQSTGIGQVNQSIVDLDRMTQQNAALVEEAAAAAQSLEQQADGLESAVAIFKLA
ncbi:methyl-accepting chemotaxis protein [Mitsuaria sp. GD03876]|uniref:methyl-accepting chemotaxis protein n=1 Tax=Mitsuaria sp. GD03876 TaxID=2975399 RepID=UPI00244750B8|nr:methyl-accepting chemotaxis protein [Mitsuaria sp. GD03876]